jgi:ERCC4-related helicase
MVRDELGICLSHELLSENLNATFTHVRAYESALALRSENAHVLLAIPQMQGRDVLHSMVGNKRLVWRADFCCPSYQK